MKDDGSGAESRADLERRRVAAQRALAARSRGAILLVGYGEAEMATMRRVLEKQPRRIEAGGPAGDVPRRIARGGVDLLLFQLPGADNQSWEILRRLKADSAVPDLQIIGVTPADDLESRLRAIALGADAVLSRPLHPLELTALVEARLEKKAALDKLRQDHQAALDAARVDPATGLWNARHFREFLDLEIKRSLRQKYKIGLLLVDVENLGGAAEALGPAGGCQILGGLGRIILGRIREVDLAARFGEEEIVVVLPFADKTTAGTVARRIQAAAGRPFPIGAGGATVSVNIRMGLAVFPDDALSPEDLIGRADRMLFKARRAGKNKPGLADAATRAS